jgi:murein DD-endopeptidase MepM/ murein hydrolase activator NlpD
MARLAPVAAAASAVLILWHAARDTPTPGNSAPAPLVYPDRPPPATANQQSAPPVLDQHAELPVALGAQQAGVATIEVVVVRNDTLDGIFRRMALDTADLAAIRNLPGIRQSLDFLKPGDAIKLTHAAGEVKELQRKVSETQTLKVVRQDDGFAAEMIANPVETRTRAATATIDSSLFQAAESADISDGVALKLADIFAWDIDFVFDIRSGDHFTAVYEQIYQDGKYLRDGDILAAEFVNDGKVYRAVRFTSAAGQTGYYTPNGLPMRKAFLRAPVEFTRISSVFDPHRFHPILQLIRGHMGTDYAAPAGTPVHASGDGRVGFAAWRGGYGNAIVLDHTNGVSTLYGHLSRFAARIHLGSRVQQGQVIGYVGMTGLATGPHLHYEYLKNGVHLDPQKVHLAGSEPLRAEELRQFTDRTASLLAKLEPPAHAPVAALDAGAAPAAPLSPPSALPAADPTSAVN